MRRIKNLFFACVCACLFVPSAANATVNASDLLDKFDLSPFVPYVLDAIMFVATAGYDFFVGGGTGIIYVLVWGFLLLYLSLYALKMFFPKIWVSFFGFSGGGDLISGQSGMNIAEKALRPCIRAIVAAAILLPIKPVYMTQWLINPFLQLGAVYTNVITDSINETGLSAKPVDCPQSVVDQAWISESSCEFLIQPVADLSMANNQIIKRGFEFIDKGLRGLITLVPHGGTDFMNLVTGIILVFTFVSSNLFMAMLVIQAIFNFGMALILYPFSVLTYVVKDSDRWLDIMPAFDGIIKALQKLIVTMIACAFILGINLAMIKALFQWHGSVFVVAAGGTAHTNVPITTNSGATFGEHSIMWLSGILTMYVMFKLFNMTRDYLNSYVGGGTDNLYKQTTAEFSRAIEIGKDAWGRLKKVFSKK